MMKNILFGILAIAAVSCKSNAQDKSAEGQETASTVQGYEVSKTEAQWQALLTPAEYEVLRKEGTEQPFTSPLLEEKSEGTLICAACYAPLYENEHKFDSGTGWPSYDRAIDGQVELDSDMTLGYKRIEAVCATCGSHLGHIFEDGPQATTGIRHCINGVALDFVPEEQALPDLRK